MKNGKEAFTKYVNSKKVHS